MHKQEPLSIGIVKQLHPATKPTNNSQSLDPRFVAVLEEFSLWRENKKKSSEPIPDELWEKIFALEEIYSSAHLRRLLGINTYQYTKKLAELRSLANICSPQEVKTQPSNPLCQVTIKPSPYEQAPLPSAKTLVVEFCRSDGKIMKIHTTQDSIPTLVTTFFKE